LDSNILLYSISSRPEDAKKREIAEARLDAPDWAISIQVLQEFSFQAMRTSRPDALDAGQVEALVRNWLQFDVQDMTGEIVVSALRLTARYKFSFWDSAIIAAALAKGCTRLLTEDLTHGQKVEGLTIVNPFAAS
jgi:predicted nucleic acid-binding protein